MRDIVGRDDIGNILNDIAVEITQGGRRMDKEKRFLVDVGLQGLPFSIRVHSKSSA